MAQRMAGSNAPQSAESRLCRQQQQQHGEEQQMGHLASDVHSRALAPEELWLKI